MKNYGVRVTAQIALNGEIHRVEYRNVTEIHYNYFRSLEMKHSKRIAFESEIHFTGITWDINDVIEFTFELENSKAKAF